MLEQIRKNSRSFVTSILFSILIAAFIISINHTPARCSADLSSETEYAVRLSGKEISPAEFFFAYALSPGKQYASYFPSQEARFRGQTMDALIERELLAQAAEEMGLHVSESEASDQIKQGTAWMMGRPFPLKPSSTDKGDVGFGFVNGKLNYEQLERILQRFNLSVRQFVEIQQREMLADKLRQTLRIGTKISTDEAKQVFADENTQVKLDYIRFSAAEIAQKLAPQPSVIQAYADAHTAELLKLYNDRKQSYQKQSKQVHLHRIWLALDKDATEEKVTAAESQLKTLSDTIKTGAVFSNAAVSFEGNQQQHGGDMGWLKKGATGLEPDQETAIFAAKPGDLIGPIRTKNGIELIQVDGFREGDISFDAAKTELALERYRDDKSKELAKQFAQIIASQKFPDGALSALLPMSPDIQELTTFVGSIKREQTDFIQKQGDAVQGIGASKELVKATFSKKAGELIGPIDIGGIWIVALVKERKEPNWDEFDKQKDTLLQRLQSEKATELEKRWASQMCIEKKKASKLQVNTILLKSDGDTQQPDQTDLMFGGKFTYEPCQADKGLFPF